MPTPERTPPRPRDAAVEYYYRRRLGVHELLPAIGVAIGAGLFAFYITRILLQRTPLKVDRRPLPARSRRSEADSPERAGRA